MHFVLRRFGMAGRPSGGKNFHLIFFPDQAQGVHRTKWICHVAFHEHGRGSRFAENRVASDQFSPAAFAEEDRHADVMRYHAGFIEHVWLHNGVEVARHYLPVGNDRRWRTWSRHRVDPGEYEVRVMGPDGGFLTKTTFTVAAEEGDEGC